MSGNPYENSFPVDIDTNKVKTIGHLKKAIKEELHPKFVNVSHNDIRLWKADISFEEEKKKLELVNTKINRPVETKEVHCTATYGRKMSREMVTLEGFKKKLCEYLTFPDGTENEHIVMGLQDIQPLREQALTIIDKVEQIHEDLRRLNNEVSRLYLSE
ncbi:27336_t:CDS:2 [Dentiscutata erythropus]|uniref:27336_t:CDS:1 n=1 Tax=Dentiscutata erythropus TaxID=1348616 RepID=A0A9N8YVX7_9GLOM|nr:27336_t:CDS:2 [Dentiscutata erythropus]